MKTKEQKERELILEVLKGTADRCDNCGTHDLKKEYQGYPFDFNSEKCEFIKIKCNKCNNEYQIIRRCKL